MISAAAREVLLYWHDRGLRFTFHGEFTKNITFNSEDYLYTVQEQAVPRGMSKEKVVQMLEHGLIMHRPYNGNWIVVGNAGVCDPKLHLWMLRIPAQPLPEKLLRDAEKEITVTKDGDGLIDTDNAEFCMRLLSQVVTARDALNKLEAMILERDHGE